MNIIELFDKLSNAPHPPLEARPAPERGGVHPSITEAQISELVDGFYTDILSHAKLAPIFNATVDGNWDSHLEKMKSFWRSVLLRSGEYKGKPVPAHQKIEGLTLQDFEQWLCVFETAVNRTFAPDARASVMEAAKRIASSLWFACSGDICPPALHPAGTSNTLQPTPTL